ncbi:hypothetical protein DTL21_17515 [Bremerella cremea]|uniref:Uncharacterized protein n=1 Tax=Blastopirellula marina TaxID=124 RepID=A0A2S8FIR0_9BACT|nr:MULTISPECIES: hypothetical protein [Pirellulaceae]PQO32041.1 hypothetical protein C5Y83_17500 [Blastopirellula marina]RCS45107.1 hypothetical protein DTL21_17515 [Bremerella cremea]
MNERHPTLFGTFLGLEAVSVLFTLIGLSCVASPLVLRGGIVGWLSDYEPPVFDRHDPFLLLYFLVDLVTVATHVCISIGVGVLTILGAASLSTGTGIAAALLGLFRTSKSQEMAIDRQQRVKIATPDDDR